MTHEHTTRDPQRVFRNPPRVRWSVRMPLAGLCLSLLAAALCGCREPAQSRIGHVSTEVGTLDLAETGCTLEVLETNARMVCRILDRQERAIGAWTFGDAGQPWAYYVEKRSGEGYHVWLNGSLGLYRPTVVQGKASNLFVTPTDAVYETMPPAFADAIQ